MTLTMETVETWINRGLRTSSSPCQSESQINERKLLSDSEIQTMKDEAIERNKCLRRQETIECNWMMKQIVIEMVQKTISYEESNEAFE